MSTVLYGPFPFDEKVVVASGRAALSVVTLAIREGRGAELVSTPATGADPGLYVLLDAADPENPRIQGFWVSFGASYAEKGPAGPPDRQPPFALELMDAATEEVWWKELPVALTKPGLWRPVLVFEWPPLLASRSGMAPPGVPLPYMEEGFDEDADSTWLDEVTADLPMPVTEVEVEFEFDDEGGGPSFTSDDWDELPLERSLVMVVRGQMEHGRALHKGTFGLVPPGAFGAQNQIPDFEQWMAACASGAVSVLDEDDDADELSRLGGPLGLPGGRIGFHALGWLTKNLETWPLRASSIRAGTLNDRVVRSRWKEQLVAAVSSSVVVLSLVISVAMGIRQAATPRPEASPEPPPPAAQPAMAQCSAEHAQFVEEFRCQVKALADGGRGALGRAVCSDRSDVARADIAPTVTEDLQAEYCGLLDRAEQGWGAKFGASDDAPKANWGEFAATQACFNVLGHPYPYELMTFGDRKVANSDRFLKDENLRVEPLMKLVADLGLACDAYRVRVEARVEGAIFATHVGDSRSRRFAGRKSLRELATDYALVGVPDEIAQCFREGMRSGLEATEYHELCTNGRGPRDAADREFSDLLIFQKLGNHLAGLESDADLIDRYTAARFTTYDLEEDDQSAISFVDGQVDRSSELWQCHMALEGRYANGRPPAASGLGQWQVRVPMPSSYAVAGTGARTQLQLDAALLPMREGAFAAGTCWDVVSKRLTQYAAVHPLLAIPDDKTWPSDEQQLCGQICAAYYGVQRSAYDGEWATPHGDLRRCVALGRPPSTKAQRDRLGTDKLDQLRIPYFSMSVGSSRYRWLSDTVDEADVCAFNLVAQGRIPGNEENGYVIEGRAPEEWAGSASDGLGIAGNARQAIDLIRRAYRPGSGGGSGVTACGDVATQCFTAVMLDVINPRRDADERVQRYEFRSTWESNIRDLADAAEDQVREHNPWCAAVYPYLLPPQRGRTGATELDEPCRRGVEMARTNALAAIDFIATDTEEVERQ